VSQVARESHLEAEVGRALIKAYPARNWLVDSDVPNRVLTVHCTDISARWGMVVHLTRSNRETVRRSVRAGGEILERYRLSRQRQASNDDALSLPHQINGEVRHAPRGERQ